MGKKNRNHFGQQQNQSEVTQPEVVDQSVQEVEALPEVESGITEQEPVVETAPVEAQPEVVDASPKVVFPSEVKEEPVKQPEPVQEQPKVELTDDAEVNAVTKILNDGKLSNVEKVEAICNSGTKYAGLAGLLKGYQEKMGASAPTPKGADGAATNYNLYVQLLAVANTPIYTEFKLKFDIVNLCFLAYANDAFSEFKLFRFSLDWKFGKDKYLTYRSLAILICMLCDKTTRQEALKKIVLSKALTLDGTKFTEVSIQNVKRYYES